MGIHEIYGDVLKILKEKNIKSRKISILLLFYTVVAGHNTRRTRFMFFNIVNVKTGLMLI